MKTNQFCIIIAFLALILSEVSKTPLISLMGSLAAIVFSIIGLLSPSEDSKK